MKRTRRRGVRKEGRQPGRKAGKQAGIICVNLVYKKNPRQRKPRKVLVVSMFAGVVLCCVVLCSHVGIFMGIKIILKKNVYDTYYG